MTDIYGMLGKTKNTNVLTIPTKKTTTSNNTTPAPTIHTATAQPRTIKPPKVRPHKVQKHKAQKRVHQQQVQQEAMKPQLSDYRLATTGDSTGVHITVLCGDTPIHKFSLLRTDYATWQRIDSQGKYAYVRVRTNASAFGNDMSIVNAVVIGTVNVLNTLFEQARQAQQAQAYKRMI